MLFHSVNHLTSPAPHPYLPVDDIGFYLPYLEIGLDVLTQ
ncbi:hypothetical protein VCRA2126E14_20180 [Vibrio crassostreae]|nr:hypothetical protein VCRA2110O2_20187 [Vibrio crassostreae]CAK3501149.1 hypothetical protein VCRA2126E14_20180 [Vibrio crassostreae]